MKVSAIMPTRGRQRLAAIAVISFLSQTYDNKELLILDDAEDPSFDGFRLGYSPSQKIEYISYDGERQTIAAKRNWLCDHARGDIIMHFDSDDWSSPDRMADQVARLTESGKALTGYNSMLFLNAYDDTAWKYHGHSQYYALGTSLAYRREWWASNPFPLTRRVDQHTETALIVGEDNAMVNAAKRAGQIITVDADKRMVARIHDGNTCKKDCKVDLNGYSFKPVDMSELPKDFWK